VRGRLALAPLIAEVLLLVAPVRAQSPAKLAIGSKAFPESWILGEALASLARNAGAEVQHRSNLGGTEIVYQALKSGAVDVYPEYTGTVAEVILKSKARPSLTEMRAALTAQGIGISESLGFNDGYALAVTRATAEKYGLRRISDLAGHPELRLGFTHEFIGRKDGYQGLAAHYGLKMPNIRGIQHELAYQAIAAGQIDLMEIYTTDAQIDRLGLQLLEDDRAFFPRYDAVLLYRLELPRRAPRAFEAMQRLVGKIDEARMTRANALVVLKKQSRQEAAAALLRESLGTAPTATSEAPSIAGEIAKDTARHLQLVSLSLLAAVLLGIPLGVLATRSPLLAHVTLAGAGLLQTIPSLALLAFLIPLFGIGVETALVALFLYSLLPIVRNTYTGLTTIPPNLSEAAAAMGLSRTAQLLRVSLPMASPAIMAGIKTSAVINVGTATLAALIGAGGLGEPILRGISLVDRALILQGAVPAALLALLVQWGFDRLDTVFIPRGLRLSEHRS
jgi:osmoprotectant transport system permease protein